MYDNYHNNYFNVFKCVLLYNVLWIYDHLVNTQDSVIFGRIACIAQMRPILTDVAHSVVCLSVCVLVAGMRPAKRNGWTDQVAVWGCLGWAQGTTGSRYPTGRDSFGKLSDPPKSTGSLCCGVCSKSDQSVLNNNMTADCSASDW